MDVYPVFLDTEFTNLNDPRLISIGIASACGREFYVELHDGWTLGDCSLFTLTQVLPFLAEGRMAERLQQVLGDKYSILKCHTNDPPDWEVLANPNNIFSPELWSWVGELESISPLLDPRGKIGEPNLGALLVEDAPVLVEAARDIDLAAVMGRSGGLTRSEAASALSHWIASFPGPVQMAWNYAPDRDLVKGLLKDGPGHPENLDFFPLAFPANCDPLFLVEIKKAGEVQLKQCGKRHHALEDARAFLTRWRKGRELNVW